MICSSAECIRGGRNFDLRVPQVRAEDPHNLIRVMPAEGVQEKNKALMP